ncbi:hypothetical protein MVI01_35730 [Myxococcus virescens]|uniref:Uncharacterized protein n=1 Tax=Myxococcus virescens TaxID=83456 RepID=A0A511HGY7_9BACT|nr:hypothetical protein MVI01_35730 [Myxococcus virescens]
MTAAQSADSRNSRRSRRMREKARPRRPIPWKKSDRRGWGEMVGRVECGLIKASAQIRAGPKV